MTTKLVHLNQDKTVQPSYESRMKIGPMSVISRANQEERDPSVVQNALVIDWF